MSAALIAVANRKGGTGKSTTAVNLAAEYAAHGHRVLLIDLDTQGHCAMGLGIRLHTGQITAHHLFGPQAQPLEAGRIAHVLPNLDLVPADPMFQHGLAPDDEGLLGRHLAQTGLLSAYDVILFDTPPSLDLLLLNALACAHWALIPFVPHALAAEGVRQLSRVFFKVAMRSNARLRLLGLLPVMMDPRIGLHKEIRAQMAHQFGEERLLPGIRNDIKLAEAFSAGQPARLYAPHCRGTADYHALYEHLLERILARQHDERT
jgi:chromosome partitioning protein